MPDNNKQQFSYNTVPTSQNNVQTLHIEKERQVVPIIFIPGIMGSNLQEKTTKPNPKAIWRLDGNMSMLGWGMPNFGNNKMRKLQLNPDVTEVDNRGTVVDAADKEIKKSKKEPFTTYSINPIKFYIDTEKLEKERIKKAINDHPENKLFGTRRERGWGTVGYRSYGEFLDKLQKSLFDPKGFPKALKKLIKPPSFKLDEGSKVLLTFIQEQIEHCNRFYFPVHAMGYNWLKSNEESAMVLKNLVEKTLPNHYKKRGLICDKVILVTHSMGGLVARYYTQVLRGDTKVYGVINGVQPSTGAVAAYTRMKRGTEVNSTFFSKPFDYMAEQVLGQDASEMTVVCAQSPGALQLLPSIEYGMGWLKIEDPDKLTESYPKSDPYEEIYLAKDKWWCVCEPHLINPFVIPDPSLLPDKPFNPDNTFSLLIGKSKRLQIMRKDWHKYECIIKYKVKTFNDCIANKYHPNTYVFFGMENDNEKIKTESKTYDIAKWEGKFFKGTELLKKKPSTNHIGANNRINLSELKEYRTLTPSRDDQTTKIIQTSTGAIIQTECNIKETYQLLSAEGNGDGTVPKCSGEIPIDKIKARMHLSVGHEPAYQSDISQEFTLRAIVDIVQQIKVKD